MVEEVGLIVKVQTKAAPGQLDRLRADVNGAVQQGAQKAFSGSSSGGFLKNIMADMRRNTSLMKSGSPKASGSGIPDPTPIKGLLNDFRTKYDPAKGFTEAAPGAVPPPKKADPMSGILGGGGGAAGGAGGMLGPLAALTIVGKGMSDMLGKMVGILATASPALSASLKLIQKTLMMFLKPIGDLLGMVLRPIARMMMEANREARRAATAARREALAAGESPFKANMAYTKTFYNTFWKEIIGAIVGAWKAVEDDVKISVEDGVKDAMDEVLKNPIKVHPLGIILSGLGVTTGDVVNASSPAAAASKAAGLDIGKAVDDALNWVANGTKKLLSSKWLPWFASGGYVPATPGGRIIGVAEAGEGEWIVPDSKVRSFAQAVGGGGTTIVVNMNAPVFGVDDLERKMRRMIDQSARESRKR